MSNDSVSRRAFLALTAAAPLALAQRKKKGSSRIPLGLELFSVRDLLAKDLMGTVRAVAKLGYQDVEFYATYFEWTPDYAKEVRKLLDDLGIRCLSTHNNGGNLVGDNLSRAIELNQTIGSKYIVMASAGRVNGLDGWKTVADHLNQAAEKLKPLGMAPGYHNHQAEFMLVDGQRPIEILAANTVKDVVLQFDVGTCLEAGCDPVAWIDKNPGRIKSMHLKDWSPEPGKGYKVLFAEGVAPWKKIFESAEKTGGVEFYLIEQEGSAYPSLETVEKCLATFKTVHG